MVKKSKSSFWKTIFSWPKIFMSLTLIFTGIMIYFLVQSAESYDYIVETNAFFAPFEFYDNRQIIGVDIDIIHKVAEKLDAKIDIKNVEFDLIIDNVASGVLADAGAAGLTITPARAEKVDFTIPYYNSIQYVIYSKERPPEMRDGHAIWGSLSGHILGTQMGSTGYLFVSSEINEGVLQDTNTTVKGLESHQLSSDAIAAHIIDYAIADQLVAQMIVTKNPSLAASPLYYEGPTPAEDYPVEEAYAIAVNKQRPELLAAFNEILADMLVPTSDGHTEIDHLILQYMGIKEEEYTNG